ncbi:MAG: DHH family phosphoesterase, partial [Pacificimonas sp.]
MADYDVFNGDADGICALIQLRLSEPRDAELVTGVKRDIALLDRVAATRSDRITVLDISVRNNRDALERNLDAGAEVFYADHHNPGEIPSHAGLTALIDTSPGTCTSLIVDRHL